MTDDPIAFWNDLRHDLDDPEFREAYKRATLELRAVQSASTDILARVPNKPKTPLRSVRIPDELWEQAQRVAAERGETVSDEIRAALERYIRRHTK